MVPWNFKKNVLKNVPSGNYWEGKIRASQNEHIISLEKFNVWNKPGNSFIFHLKKMQVWVDILMDLDFPPQYISIPSFLPQPNTSNR